MRCANCNENISIKEKICPECGFDNEKPIISIKNNMPCDICHGRGRGIEIGSGKDKKIIYRCYACNLKDYTSRSYKSDTTKSRETINEQLYFSQIEIDYYKARERYYLIPLFYGEEPNFELLRPFQDSMTAFELRKIKQKRDI